MNPKFRKAKLSLEGKRVLNILKTEYLMSEEAAIRLMQDCGSLFAIAVLNRRKMS